MATSSLSDASLTSHTHTLLIVLLLQL